ncbi:hypothetical protein RB595_010686 [Gaeumannomyces hyphopodioides]
MSIRNSPQTMPLQGFTIFQTTLGATLQFEPALNSPELDTLIDAYVAGSDTIQQKRAAVCVEFFSYAAQTGQTNDLQLFFPIFPKAHGTESPASLGDSGCGSGFDASPVVPDMTWDSYAMATPTTPATPATPSSAFVAPSQNRVTKSRAAGSSRKAGPRASAGTANDFSHIPGMKILTKDGVDVTNSASRGSKTKAMREHAHLIRLLKACDSCKKKKVRCDPSHKRRASGPAPAAVETAKAKKTKSGSPPVTPRAESAAQQASFQVASADTTPFEAHLESLDSFDWEKFMQPEDDIFSLPIDYNYTLDARGFLTPSSGSSCSPSQPFTPAPAVGLASFEAHHSFAASSFDLQAPLQQPQLPYLHNDGHTSDYVDFTLYSPASSFLDEEPQELQSTGPSPSSAFIGWSGEPATTGHERKELQEGAEHRQSHQRVRAVSPSAALDRGASDPDRPPRVPHQDDPECPGGVLGSRLANPGNSHMAAAHNNLGGAVSTYREPPSIHANAATPEEAPCGQDLHGCSGGGGGGRGGIQSQQQLLGAFSAVGPTDEQWRKRKPKLSKTLSPDQQSWSSSVSSDTTLAGLSVPLALGALQAARSCVDGGLSDFNAVNAVNAGYMVAGNMSASPDAPRQAALVSKTALLTAVESNGTEGTTTISKGTTTITEGTTVITEGTTAITEGTATIAEGTTTIAEGTTTITATQASSPALAAQLSSNRFFTKQVESNGSMMSPSSPVNLATQKSSTIANSYSAITQVEPRNAATVMSTRTRSEMLQPTTLSQRRPTELSECQSPLYPQPQKGLSSNARSWELLALLGFMLALAKQAQEASALLFIVALLAASKLLQHTSSERSVARPTPSTPQLLSSWDESKATESDGANGNSVKLTTQLDGLRSATSHRMSRCLRQWTAICGC